ncbi:hypothetical protein OFM04_31560, partial [Escherichia coli]|nr:hypothetical protein [Escherichia coli]
MKNLEQCSLPSRRLTANFVKVLYSAKVSATVEGERKSFHGLNSLEFKKKIQVKKLNKTKPLNRIPEER